MLDKLLAKAAVSADSLAHLVSVTRGCTGAQLEELVKTLYILAVESYPDPSGNSDGHADPIPLNRRLINAALDEVQIGSRQKFGFHVA